MTVAVRRLTEAQWRDYAQLRLRALSDVTTDDGALHRREMLYTAAQWRRRLREDAQFAAWRDDRAVGLIGAHRPDAHRVYLYSLWLDPGARGHGTSRMLVGAALDWAHGASAVTVTLRVLADNDVARAVYEEFGFSEVPAAPEDPGGAGAEVTMAVTLGPSGGSGP